MKKSVKRKSPKKPDTESRITALEARIAALEARPFVVVQPVKTITTTDEALPWVRPQPPYVIDDGPPWGKTWC